MEGQSEQLEACEPPSKSWPISREFGLPEQLSSTWRHTRSNVVGEECLMSRSQPMWAY